VIPLVTLIPARGGSKGVVEKNLQIINGKNLVERAAIAALQITQNRIVVSSDSLEILNSVRHLDVELSRRSDINSRDISTTEDVIQEVISSLDISNGTMCLIQPTNPFIDISGIRKAIHIVNSNSNVDSVFSAVEKNYFLWRLEHNWKPIGHDKFKRLPRQSQPQTVVETGSFYVFKINKFIQESSRFCGVTEPVLTNYLSSFDIDTYDELEFCQQIASYIEK
jgi:N-acylneuraminate cytidylyltransferase